MLGDSHEMQREADEFLSTNKQLSTKSNKFMQRRMQWVETVIKEDDGIALSTYIGKTSDSVLMRHRCLLFKQDKGVAPEAASAESGVSDELKALRVQGDV